MVDASATANRFLGDCYRAIGDIVNAKACYHTALSLMRGTHKHVHDCERLHACSNEGNRWYMM